jgi:glycosyltransferase involved in cell wall biosynthesis
VNETDFTSSPSTVILLPVYNSGLYLRKVLLSIELEVWDEISHLLVLDNASRDDSLRIIEDFKTANVNLSHKIVIQTHESNLGYGGSVAWGLNWALTRRIHYVMILHSDDQADWGLVAKSLIGQRGNGRIVVTSRLHQEASMKGYDLKRNLGNRFFKIVTFLATGIRMSDPGSAIGLFPTDAIIGSDFQKFDVGYLYHPQLNLILYSNKDFEVREIPLDWKDASVNNHFPMLRYGFSLLSFLIRIAVFHRILKMPMSNSVSKAVK